MAAERQARIRAMSHSGVVRRISSKPRLATASIANPASTVSRTVNRTSTRGP
jgi:hypothetical protein